MAFVLSVWNDLVKSCPVNTKNILLKQIDRDPISKGFKNIDRECCEVKFSDDQLKLAVVFWQNLVEILVFIRNYHSSEIDFQFLIKEEIEDKDNILLSLGFISMGGGIWRCQKKPDSDTICNYVWICCILEHIYDIRETIKNQEGCGEKFQIKKIEGNHGNYSNPHNSNGNKMNSSDHDKIALKMKKNTQPTDLPNKKKNQVDQEILFTWKCTNCNHTLTQSTCPSCDIERPSIGKWVCTDCGLYNNLFNKECEGCYKLNDNMKLCGECKSVYIIKSASFCSECLIKKTNNQQDNGAVKLTKKKKTSTKGLSNNITQDNQEIACSWKCPDCTKIVTQTTCPSCNIERPRIGEWVCQFCSNFNEKSAKDCMSCGKMNDITKLCGECKNVHIIKSASFCSECLITKTHDRLKSIYDSKLCEGCKNIFSEKEYCELCWNEMKKAKLICKKCGQSKEIDTLDYCYSCLESKKNNKNKKKQTDLLCKECKLVNVGKSQAYCEACYIKYGQQIDEAKSTSRVCKECGSPNLPNTAVICKSCIDNNLNKTITLHLKNDERNCWKCSASFDATQTFCESCGVQWKEDFGWIKQRKTSDIVDIWRCSKCSNFNDMKSTQCSTKKCTSKRPDIDRKLCNKCNLYYLSPQCTRCGDSISTIK